MNVFQVFGHIEREPEILYLGTKKPERIQGNIEFRNVCFTYPSRPQDVILKVGERYNFDVQLLRRSLTGTDYYRAWFVRNKRY